MRIAKWFRQWCESYRKSYDSFRVWLNDLWESHKRYRAVMRSLVTYSFLIGILTSIRWVHLEAVRGTAIEFNPTPELGQAFARLAFWTATVSAVCYVLLRKHCIRGAITVVFTPWLLTSGLPAHLAAGHRLDARYASAFLSGWMSACFVAMAAGIYYLLILGFSLLLERIIRTALEVRRYRATGRMLPPLPCFLAIFVGGSDAAAYALCNLEEMFWTESSLDPRRAARNFSSNVWQLLPILLESTCREVSFMVEGTNPLGVGRDVRGKPLRGVQT